MKFTIRRTALMKMLRVVNSGKEKGVRDAHLRVSAHNATVTLSANDVEASFGADIAEPGVCFFQYAQFLPLIKRYPGIRSLLIEATPDGIRIGNTVISRGLWEVSLFGNPAIAPERFIPNRRRPTRDKPTPKEKHKRKGAPKQVNFILAAIDGAERRLARQVDDADVDINEPFYIKKIKGCDLCKSPANEMCLFVDGKLRNQAGWANMCAACFIESGQGIGPEVGQLYARQADERWRLVRGFPTTDIKASKT